MNRRDYLATTAVFTSGLAGCAEDQTVQQSTPSPTPDPFAFELVGVDAPDEIEIGKSLSYAFEVKNTADEERTFETEVRSRIGTGNDWGRANTWTEQIPAGETKVLESDQFTANYMGDFEVHIVELDETISITFTSATRGYGYDFDIWNGAIVSVVDVHFADEIGRYQPESGKFARAYITAENASNEVIYLPAPSNFSMLIGNSQHDPLNITEDEFYEGGEVQPGVIREGYVNFEVGNDVTVEDIITVWSITESQGSIAVYWSEDGDET